MKVRALVDIPGTKIKSGEFFLADRGVARGLIAIGEADDKAREEDVYRGGAIPEPKRHPSFREDKPEDVPDVSANEPNPEPSSVQADKRGRGGRTKKS